MKLRTIAVSVIFLLIPLVSYGQEKEEETPEFKWNVSINPVVLLQGGILGGPDYAITDRITLGGRLGYASQDYLLAEWAAILLGVRGNYYLTGRSLSDSWYVGSALNYQSVAIRALSATASLSAIRFDVLGGYQWVWKKGFNLALGIGPNYTFTEDPVTLNWSDGTTTTPDNPPYKAGIGLVGEIQIGWAF